MSVSLRWRRVALLALLASLVTVAAIAVLPSAQAATGDGSPSDPNIAFVGRWDKSNATAYVPNWAGAYFLTGFTGTTVKLSQRNTIDLYYSIDGGADVYITNVSGTVNLTPTVLRSGNHTLRVSYRVVAGSYAGDAVFQGLILDSGARTLAAALPSRLLEFVGDSITVGTTSLEERADRLRMADRRAAWRRAHPDRVRRRMSGRDRGRLCLGGESVP